MKLSKEDRKKIRMMFGGKCAYCGVDLPEKGWHADHIEPVGREWWKKTEGWKERHAFRYEWDEATGRLNKIPVEVDPMGMERPDLDKIENLFPSCRACNIDKHASSLTAWRKQLQDRVGVCRRNYSAFRHAERFGLVQEIKKPVVFWFERYSIDCTPACTPDLETTAKLLIMVGETGIEPITPGLEGCEHVAIQGDSSKLYGINDVEKHRKRD